MRSEIKALHVRFPKGNGYPIFFEPLEALPALMREVGLRPGRCLVVTDRNVAEHHSGRMDGALRADGWEPLVLALPAGEETKSPQHLQVIYDAALSWGIDRKTPILALGGGVVGDVSGLAAATLLRGIPLVHAPTSLLAQVDSSIGGKTGINHASGKNLIGAFHQPALVGADPTTLSTLPMREWLSGTAEVIKHALIGDQRLFEMLEAEFPRFIARQESFVQDVVYRAVRVKTDIVSRDEREQGVRTMLNFGHTFGHALERATGYGTLTHGEAVAIGMRAALYLSRRFSPKLDFARADHLVRQLPTPPVPAELAITELREAMRTDKKAEAGKLRFVLLKRIGEAYVTDQVSPVDVDAAWTHALTPA